MSDYAAMAQAIGAAYDTPMRCCPTLANWSDHCATRVLLSLPELDGLVADIGAGNGGIAVWVARGKPGLTIRAVEPSEVGRQIAAAELPEDVADRITHHAGIAEWLPFPDATFDAVYSSHVFEHILRHGPALAEIARVLKPGAPLFLIVPEGETYNCDTHVHWWSVEQFRDHLQPYAREVETWQGPESQIVARVRF